MPPNNSTAGAPARRETEQNEKTPAVVRTMRSDIAEFLKAAKPSLFERGAARQSELSAGIRGKTRLALKILGTLIIIGVLAGGGFLAYEAISPPPPPPPPPPPAPPPPPPQAPPPLIFFESSEEVLSLRAAHELQGALAANRHSGLPGEFHRIVVRISDAAGIRQVLTAREFFALIGATPPEDFLLALTQPPQFFTYRSTESAPALGMLFATGDPSGAVGALALWEPRLAEELSPIITASSANGGETATTSPALAEPAPATRLPDGQTGGASADAPSAAQASAGKKALADKTAGRPAFSGAVYRNIPYRFRKLEPDQDRGLGYFAFPAENLIVIAASEETIKRTIDRMFQGR